MVNKKKFNSHTGNSNCKRIDEPLLRMKSSENLWLSGDFRGEQKLTNDSPKFASYWKQNLETIPLMRSWNIF